MMLVCAYNIVTEKTLKMAVACFCVPRGSSSCFCLSWRLSKISDCVGPTLLSNCSLHWDTEYVFFHVPVKSRVSLLYSSRFPKCKPCWFSKLHSGDFSSQCRSPKLGNLMRGLGPLPFGVDICRCYIYLLWRLLIQGYRSWFFSISSWLFYIYNCRLKTLLFFTGSC